MRKKFKQLITSIILTLTLLCTTLVPAYAETYTNIYSAGTATAGIYKTESIHKLTSYTLDTVYGGDVGIWFYTGNSGLQASFYRDENRKCNIECWEDDSTYDVRARQYTGYYAYENGIYYMKYISVGTISSSCIESDSTVDLYMRFRVNTNSKDTSRAVPENTIRYRFWIY